ncbi:MAG: signal peptidase II [Chloroflexota bacterium]|nr:signal peptidase II [Chloroflexota bacterium]
MTNWAFLSPLFRAVLMWGLVADWGSKILVNVVLEPLQLPIRSLSDLVGKVYPYPPTNVSIAHVEHWHKGWPDLEEDFIGRLITSATSLFERFTAVDAPEQWIYIAVIVSIPLLISLSSLGKRRPQPLLSAALGLWFVALIGNKGEVLLFGHATDWIWIRFWRFSVFTNLADLAAFLALVMLWFRPKPQDNGKVVRPS